MQKQTIVISNKLGLHARASAKLADAWQQWPSGASYTISVMDDHIVVWASCAGEERQDDWLP